MNDFLQNLRNGQAEKQRPQKTRKTHDNSFHYTNPKFHSYGGYQSNRPQHAKKSQAQSQSGNHVQAEDNLVTSMLAEAIENLSTHIEILTKNQADMIDAQVKAAEMLERQVNAVERILNHLNIAPLPEITPPKKKAAKEVFKNHYVTSPKSKSDNHAFTKTAAKAFKSLGKTPVKASKAPVKDNKPVKPVLLRRKKIVEKKSAPVVKTNDKFLGREAIMEIINTMRSEGKTFDQVAIRLVELGQPTFSGRGEWHAQTIHRLCSKK